MDDKREVTIQRLRRTSRGATLLWMALGLAGAILVRQAAGWVSTLGYVLLGLAALLFSTSWLMPGIFVLRRAPWYALAWLEGANPLARVRSEWEQLSDFNRMALYMVSVFLAVFILAFVINEVVAMVR